MLYEMNKAIDQPYIEKYGKAYGTVLLHRWLPHISRTKNLFVIDSYEEFKKIESRLPEVFTCRADAKTGEFPTLRSRRKLCKERASRRLHKKSKKI